MPASVPDRPKLSPVSVAVTALPVPTFLPVFATPPTLLNTPAVGLVPVRLTLSVTPPTVITPASPAVPLRVAAGVAS